ncbi:hypothetical protein K502DRAFT_35703 [Neoconidiobolus thromboides FSU 785]|nr:hypothetical protein K502DRAFT_35703 [Neoconidiobolus thromboides FSU 785]
MENKKPNLADVFDEAMLEVEEALSLSYFNSKKFQPKIEVERFKVVDENHSPEQKLNNLLSSLKDINSASDKLEHSKMLLFPRSEASLKKIDNGHTKSKKISGIPFMNRILNDLHLQKNNLKLDLLREHRKLWNEIKPDDKDHLKFNESILTYPLTSKLSGQEVNYSLFDAFKQEDNGKRGSLSEYALRFFPKRYKVKSLADFNVPVITNR